MDTENGILSYIDKFFRTPEWVLLVGFWSMKQKQKVINPLVWVGVLVCEVGTSADDYDQF